MTILHIWAFTGRCLPERESRFVSVRLFTFRSSIFLFFSSFSAHACYPYAYTCHKCIPIRLGSNSSKAMMYRKNGGLIFVLSLGEMGYDSISKTYDIIFDVPSFILLYACVPVHAEEPICGMFYLLIKHPLA